MEVEPQADSEEWVKEILAHAKWQAARNVVIETARAFLHRVERCEELQATENLEEAVRALEALEGE